MPEGKLGYVYFTTIKNYITVVPRDGADIWLKTFTICNTLSGRNLGCQTVVGVLAEHMPIVTALTAFLHCEISDVSWVGVTLTDALAFTVFGRP